MPSHPQRKLRLMFGLIFFVLGPCVMLAVLVSAWNTRQFLRHSVTAQATVVRQVAVKFRHTGMSYAPIFTFIAVDGRPYTVTSHLASSPPTYAIGALVTVHYEKDHPEDAIIHSFGELWLFKIIWGSVSFLFTLLFLAVIFARPRPPRIYHRSDFPPPANPR
jgi:hypothetical protein